MKGQQLRPLILDKFLINEVSTEFHISIETESIVNKDNFDRWDRPEFVGYSFDMTVTQQVNSLNSEDTTGKNPNYFVIGGTNRFYLATVDANKTTTRFATVDMWCTGIDFTAPNRKVMTATTKFEGHGGISLSDAHTSALSDEGAEVTE